MLAVLLTQIDGITMPSLSTIDKPELVAGSVRVCVRAASVNRADLLMRAGGPASQLIKQGTAGVSSCLDDAWQSSASPGSCGYPICR